MEYRYFTDEQIQEIKEKYKFFKATDDYKKRQIQTEFVPWAQNVIRDVINHPDNNPDQISAFLNLFSPDAKRETIEKYLSKIYKNNTDTDRYLSEYDKIKQNGYTRPPNRTIDNHGDFTPYVSEVKLLLKEIDKATNASDIEETIKGFEGKGIPNCKHRTYSPWIHYLKPKLCPIVNNPVYDNFFNYCKLKYNLQIDEKSYLWAFELLTELKNHLSEDDFGLIDAFLVNEKIWTTQGEPQMNNTFTSELAILLQTKKNLILHGAPGTGKTYTARQIAAQMMFNKSYDELTEAEQDEIGFVQFHPSYDYTDFVEGLRPVEGNDGQIGFERRDGVFKAFCAKSLKKHLESKNSIEEVNKSISYVEQIDDAMAQELINKFESDLKKSEYIEIKSLRSKLTFKVYFDHKKKKMRLDKSQGDPYDLKREKIINYLKTQDYDRDHDTYDSSVGAHILDNYKIMQNHNETNLLPQDKKFVFIIDEINRGDISKIFGELFFCIEPSYRGPKGKVATQYQNLVEKGDAFETGFYIPENVYIIGTMNDIDRSVESMDFAMRRRFDFYEVTAEASANAMGIDYSDNSPLKRLNDAIEEKLGIDYQIGGSYFIEYKNDLNNKDKLKELWTRNLKGLLKEYLRGQRDAKEKLDEFERAFYG